MTLQKRRGFRAEDYARNHPGGRLGRRLTMRVRDVMPAGEDSLPAVALDTKLMEVLFEISAKAMGATCVLSPEKRLLGIITDNDIRRAIQRAGAIDLANTAEAIMNPSPAVVIYPDQLAFEAMRCMEDRPRPVSVAPVVDESNICVGMIRVHDLLRAGL
jgi:arabinose-5-phosphate isomerase